MIKKDNLIGVLRVIVGLGLLSYVIYLWYNHIDIVPGKDWSYDLAILAIVWIISLVMIFVWIAKPCFKKPRIIQAIMWIFLILFAQYSGITDNYEIHQYLWDILKVIWSLALALSFGKICVYDKCSSIEKQIESWEMEIIEIWDDTTKYTSSKKKKDEDIEIIEA